VFRLLVRRGRAGFTPSELAGRLDIPAPTLAFHLRELVRAGLIGCALADEACRPRKRA